MAQNTSTAVMARRAEAPDSLDFFPTPPWATRALFVHVLPHLGIGGGRIGIAWEPACGEGHMAEPIAEFAEHVIASDVHDYGYGESGVDFLGGLLEAPARNCKWIITNPPFVVADRFAVRAFQIADDGVALLLRTQWIEGGDRYRDIFSVRPPTVFAPFVERVPMEKGRWDPDGSSATSYSWFVWVTNEPPRPPFWIPPGCKERLSRPNDRARFAAWSLASAASPTGQLSWGEMWSKPLVQAAE